MRSVSSTIAAASLPLLLRLEPELAHRLALTGLRWLRSTWRAPESAAQLAVDCAGLRFAHPVGVAAGFDKDGECLDALGAVGFSHVEVGTVTPSPQPGNPKPRLFRIPAARAVVNRMGFNSKGLAHVARNVQRSRFRGVLGISIGKNVATPIERADEDYLECFRALYGLADYIAINVSSPNTPNLRELQTGEGLRRVIGSLQDERARQSRAHATLTPLFVKLAPDLTRDELTAIAAEMRRLGVDGVIATNTTVHLEGVPGIRPVHAGGGLSGTPLHRRSLAAIAQLRSELGPSFPIIGVGGITSPEAALATLRAGASVIQLYTGLVYRGPSLLNEILDALEEAHSGRDRK
jgi:dihydroorotate dehydrogenase